MTGFCVKLARITSLPVSGKCETAVGRQRYFLKFFWLYLSKSSCIGGILTKIASFHKLGGKKKIRPSFFQLQ